MSRSRICTCCFAAAVFALVSASCRRRAASSPTEGSKEATTDAQFDARPAKPDQTARPPRETQETAVKEKTATPEALPTTIPKATLIQAFETGRSFALVKVLEVESMSPQGIRLAEGAAWHVTKVKVLRFFVEGDLGEDELGQEITLFGGASYGSQLRPGATYALFIVRDMEGYTWAHRDDMVKIDPTDLARLDALDKAVRAAYAETSIRRFREATIDPTPPLPELSEELRLACARLHSAQSGRARWARQIGESDMGSRVDKSRLTSSALTFLAPKLVLSRAQTLHFFGSPTFKQGRTYHWHCGRDDSIAPSWARRWPTRSRRKPDAWYGFLSVTFDSDEHVRELRYRLVGGLPDILGALPVTWGPPARGVQCRLRADRKVWKHGEEPTFRVDIRNGGELEQLGAWVDGRSFWVYLDGELYVTLFEGKVQPEYSTFGPGREHKDIRVSFEGRYYLRGGARQPLKPTHGLHVVHVSFVARHPGWMKGLSVTSNPVAIEVLPEGEAVTE